MSHNPGVDPIAKLNILLVINDGPWSSTLAATALRLAHAMLHAGHCLEAVFFRGDGAYHAVDVARSDSGSADLSQGWAELARDSSVPLLVCQASSSRRLDGALCPGFREAGLVELVDLADQCDRVVTF